MKKTTLTSCLLTSIGALTLSATACSGPTGRVMGEDEGTLVDSRKAGIEVFERLIRGTTQQMIAQAPRIASAAGKGIIAVVAVENAGVEELGEHREYAFTDINTVIAQSGAFDPVSYRFVEAALRETGLRHDQLFFEKERDKFKSILRKDGLVPDYLCWAKVTSATSNASGDRQRNYVLTLELVDANTGRPVITVRDEARKYYER